MNKLPKFFTNLKNFFITYQSTVKIVWDMDKSSLIKITLANSVIGALVYPSLLVSKMLIDSVVDTIATHNVEIGLRTIIIATILGWLIDSLQGLLHEIDFIYSNSLPRLLNEKLMINISRKINTLPVPTAEDPETRNLLQKVLDNSGRSVWSLVIPLSTFPEIIFTLISTAIPIITFQPLFILPTIILSIPNILIGVRYSKDQHQLSTTFSPMWRIWGALEDFSIKGRYLYENKILNHVDVLLKRRIKMASGYFNTYQKINTQHAKRRQLVGIPISLFQTGTRFYLYFLAITGKLTLGTAQITSNSIDRFINNFGRLIRQANDIFQNYLFIADYEKFMAIPDENSLEGLSLPDTVSQGIEFKDIWFKYNRSANWILKGVSFKINPSDNVAIVGENGAGKTTLIKLLCRFYEPQKGEILLDGVNIKNYSFKEYRHKLSALFQDFAQYPFSVEDNIRFGDIRKKKSRKAIKRAAMLTGIEKFIQSLPLGYKNPLDKEFANGIEPSKGQWQRVALSRILYRDDALILILDEPTSNVDPKSEEEIFDQVIRVGRNKIVILISHRFSTVRKADKIVVLENGVIADYGNHDELMKHDGRYRELFDLQAKSYR